MQEEIVNYLKAKYNPDVVILHGSRARKMEREHSDWDFILLYKSPTEHTNGRELYKEQNIELQIELLPIGDIEYVFGTKLQDAKVLYEKGKEGTELLTEAQKSYAKGVQWSEKKRASHELWIQGRIDGMKDNVDRPEVFYKYFSDFYQRIFSYWYWILKKEYSQPIYIAVDEIVQKDPDYYDLVTRLIDSDVSLEEKVVTAKKIKDHLFK